ncbi:MAG: Unknown protein [uncultured Sulfurovum sp.]|uniref:DUF6933 domain-containing protein n=1 Tax=uncultured Sulfurovum sp. TaxID=269237 RepID=A0A6S6U0E8_9BACT|nr:MAG: Unknown protein [uncultured Sulfurovum sp.]
MIIQATKKLQDMVGVKTTELPTESDSFTSWHGNIFMIGRKKCLLVTHNESLYSVFLYGVTKKEMNNLREILKSHLAELLRRDDFVLPHIVKMLDTLESITYMKTSDRSVMGNMNDMVHMLKYYNMTEDELSLSARINHTPYSRGKFHFPVDILKRLLEEIK